MHKLIVHNKASDEIEEIVDYYKTINSDLSICFIDELEKILSSISVFPESFELVSN